MNKRNPFSNFPTEELKELLAGYYEMLGNVNSYKHEKTIDNWIHGIKKELRCRGIYVREKIKPIFIKTK